MRINKTQAIGSKSIEIIIIIIISFYGVRSVENLFSHGIKIFCLFERKETSAKRSRNRN